MSVIGGTHGVVGGTFGVVGAGGGTPPPDMVQEQQGVSSNGSGTTTTTVTLGSAPTPGNTLLLVQGARVPLADFNDPSGWTVLTEWDPAGNSLTAWRLYAKISDGTETTSPAITLDSTSTNLRQHYAEWSGLAPLASIYDDVNSLHEYGASGTFTSWDPAAVTADQDRAVYLPILRLNVGHTGIDSDWAGVDASQGAANLLVAHKIVTDGSPIDTAVSWFTTRAFDAEVVVLRGAS